MHATNFKKTISGLAMCSLLASCLIGPQSKRGSVVDNELRVGVIYNADGGPAANARVRVIPVSHVPDTTLAGSSPAESDSSFSTITDETGKYAVGTLPDGEYNILANLSGEYAYQDSILLTGQTAAIPGDTLDHPGSLSGIVALQPNHDPRSVTVQVLGTNSYANVDDKGAFQLTNLAKGKYTLRILTALPEYVPLFKSIKVTSGKQDTLKDTLHLAYLGIPVVLGLKATYDTLRAVVTVAWDSVNYRDFSEYQVYRDFSPALDLSKTPIGIVSDTLFRDSLLKPIGNPLFDSNHTANRHLEYRIRVKNKSDQVGLSYGSLKVEAVSPQLVKTVIKLEAGIAAWDSIRQVDSIGVKATLKNPTRGMVKMVWSIGNQKDSVKEESLGGVLDAEKSYRFGWAKEGSFRVFVRVEDVAGTVWMDSLLISGNTAPTLSGAPLLKIKGNQAYEFKPSAADLDKDKLRFMISNKPAWARFDSLTGVLSGAPINTDAGVYPGISISVADGRRTARLAAFQIEVAANAWSPRKPSPANSIVSYAVTIGEEIYLLGPKGGLYSYDPAGDTWAIQPSMPGNIFEVTAATEWNGLLLAFSRVDTGTLVTGTRVDETPRAYIFDPIGKTWEAKPKITGDAPYSLYGAATIDGIAYTFWREIVTAYDPVSNNFTLKKSSDFETAALVWEYPAITAIKGKVYATSWHEGMNAWKKTAGVLRIYDPVMDSWKAAPSIEPREYATVVTDGEKLFVAGGWADVVSDKLEVFDPASGTWLLKSPIPKPTTSMAATAWHAKLFFFQGSDTYVGGATDRVWEYDPDLDK